MLQEAQPHTAASQGPEGVPGDSASTTCCSDQLWEKLHESIHGLTQAFPYANVLQSVKNLLESGDVVCFFLLTLNTDTKSPLERKMQLCTERREPF